MTVEPSLVAFGLAAAGHAGFQLTVTAVVYPALARVPPPQWSTAHGRHSRSIAPVVVLVYGALVAAGAWAVTAAPSPTSMVAVASGAACIAATALFAAPTHGRLGEPDPGLVRRLLAVDRVRAGLAVACLAAAVMALVA